MQDGARPTSTADDVSGRVVPRNGPSVTTSRVGPVSRRHLEIRVTPQGVVATDLGSTNGLFVEGHQVPAATLLDGNTLTIGRTRIMFWTGEADASGDE